jgi:hypothetical protein
MREFPQLTRMHGVVEKYACKTLRALDSSRRVANIISAMQIGGGRSRAAIEDQ